MENTIKILENGMIKIMGDYTNFYNKNNDSIDETCPVSFDGLILEEIDKDCMILEVDDCDWTISIDGKTYTKEDFKEEIDVDGFIEHLQEMRKVAIGDCNVSELQEKLESRGYITEISSSDRDYLILVERN